MLFTSSNPTILDFGPSNCPYSSKESLIFNRLSLQGQLLLAPLGWPDKINSRLLLIMTSSAPFQ